MNSKRTFSLVKKVVAVAGASLVFASLASAQEMHGHFTLPFAARWGTANLPAGRYTIRVGHTPVGMGMIEVKSDAKGSATAFVFSAIDATSPSLIRSSLVCIREGSTGIVRALELRPLNETMYFRTPKGAQIYAQNRNRDSHTLLAAAPELLERLPVTVSGK